MGTGWQQWRRQRLRPCLVPLALQPLCPPRLPPFSPCQVMGLGLLSLLVKWYFCCFPCLASLHQEQVGCRVSRLSCSRARGSEESPPPLLGVL